MSIDQCASAVTRSIASALLLFSCAGPSADAAEAGLPGAARTGATPVPERRAAVHGPAVAGIPSRSLPLRFELNQGQADPQVRFLSSTQSGQVFLTSREMVLRVRQPQDGEARKTAGRLASPKNAVVRLQVLNPNPDARIVGLDPLPGKTNYFIGNDPAKWQTGIPSFARVKYESIYPGIDLVYYGKEGHLEYDFNVAPGADPGQIALSVEGTEGVSTDDAGNLVLRTALGDLCQRAPHVYQIAGSGTREVAGGYLIHRDGTIAFTLASYDASSALVIDPELLYSTYFGGTAETDIHALTIDSEGAVYVAGDTYAHDFPTRNPVQSSNLHSQSLSAIVSKFSPDGASLVYSTYLGGSTSAIDVAVGIVLDSTGAAYVTGTAGSSDFPTKNSIVGRGNGIFVTKLSADGSSLVYSSVFGGSAFDNPRGIALDGSNAAYIFGDTQSTDFPTVNPTQPASGGGGFKDGFWSVISPDGSQLLFSTYVGGNNDDDIRSLIVLPKTGDVYLSGQTQSSGFEGNDGSLRPYHAHFQPAPVSTAARSQPSFEVPVYRTYSYLSTQQWVSIGRGTYVPYELFLIYLDEFGVVPPVGQGEHQAAEQQAGEIEAFVSSGCVAIPPSTTCSGNAAIVVADAATLAIKSVVNLPDTIPPVTAAVKDAQGAIYVTGAAGRSSAPPLVDPIQGAKGGGDDGFVMVFAPVTRDIVFSTYLGGNDDDEPNAIALDPHGNIYVAGQTQSPNFPTVNAFQATPPAPNGASIGDGNSFIAKISAPIAAPAGPAVREPVKPASPRRGSTHSLPPRSGK